jgi:DNA-binding NarL/FixJ family response regulator
MFGGHMANNQNSPVNRSPRGARQLTRREREVLDLILQGAAYKQVAGQLHISLSTVRSHLHAAYRKLEVRSGAEAAVKLAHLAALAGKTTGNRPGPRAEA